VKKKILSAGFTYNDVFKPEQELLDIVVDKYSENEFELNGELTRIEDFYTDIKQLAVKIDSTLSDHVEALKTKTVKRLLQLEKKMKSAERESLLCSLYKYKSLKQHCSPTIIYRSAWRIFPVFMPNMAEKYCRCCLIIR